jgi:hypothetical protein
MNVQDARHWCVTSIILVTLEYEIKRMEVPSQPSQIIQETLSWKYPVQKGAGRVAQVVEPLPNKLQALSFTPSNSKKNAAMYNFSLVLNY